MAFSTDGALCVGGGGGAVVPGYVFTQHIMFVGSKANASKLATAKVLTCCQRLRNPCVRE